jgi:hypothetical protein
MWDFSEYFQPIKKIQTMEDKNSSGIQKKLRPLIDLIDELRENGVSHFISLPSIVVVGDQSSGKSSVIESLSGLELPRGIGCVTRCPIIIRMVRSFENKNEIIFNEQQLKSPEELPDKILQLQEKLTGNKKGISDTPINITVYSPDVYDLTLIDLPGKRKKLIHFLKELRGEKRVYSSLGFLFLINQKIFMNKLLL